MIRFNFELRPVGEIKPWTNGEGVDSRLHWFALSDGWFWITVEEVELFRFSEGSLREWRTDSNRAVRPYADYCVVRLWEDVVNCLPEFLEPVPADLHAFVRGGLCEWDETNSSSADAATEWWAAHTLTNGYMIAPRIRWWRDATVEHDVMITDWTASSDLACPSTGSKSVDTSEFIEAVEDFDARFISAMAVQIEIAANGGVDPSIRLDVEELFSQHLKRAEYLPKSRERILGTDWAVIRQGAREVQLPN
jgi:hypothetical protein